MLSKDQVESVSNAILEAARQECLEAMRGWRRFKCEIDQCKESLI
jgi:hypothetical protein